MSEFTSENDVVRGEAADVVDDAAIAVTDDELEAELDDELDNDLDNDLDNESDDELDDELDDDDTDEIDGVEAVTTVEAAGSQPVAFTELGLPEALVKTLADKGVQTAFPIQAATIPDALAGRHVLGKARTGSGKTLAFGLAALANLNGKRARKGKPLALVLVPTRELAMQVSDALQPYGFAVGAEIAAVYGGAPMYKQVFALRRGVELLVATPGRLTDLIEQEECDLSEVAIAILDEADQMADMGFMPIVSELLSQTDPAGQRLLFSATLDGAVDELVRQYMTDPVRHSVTPDDDEPARMDHHLLVVEPADKSLVTAEIAARHTPGGEDGRRTILFARTKLGADRIAEKIREAGVSALALHGGMTQRARTKTLADFKDGRVPVLVATDVAARGIHVDGIDLVLHVDPAGDPKDYLHRAGRTARAGESGTVVTLVLPKQRKATLRLLEQAGVDAELTKVTPSSETLRELTGGRPVAEYVAEADAYHAARRAAREARMTEDRRDGREGSRDNRGGREFRGGRDGFRQDRDRFDRGHRGGRFEDRDSRGAGGGRERAGFGGERSGFGGERRSFGDRDNRGGFGNRDGRGGFGNQDSRGAEGRGGFGSRDSRGGYGDRDNRGSEGRAGFGGERRSFSDRDSRGTEGRGGFGNRDNRGAEGRGGFGSRDNRGGFSGERRSFGDRDNRGGFNDRNGADRDARGGRDSRSGFDGARGRGFERDGGNGYRGNRGASESRGSGGFGAERRSFGDRDGQQRGHDRNGSQNRGFDRDRGGYGDRNPSQNRGFNRDRDFGDRAQNRGDDRRSGQRGGFDGDRRGDRDTRDTTRGGFGDRDRTADRATDRRTPGERTAFGRPRGGYSNERDNRPPRDRRG